MRVPARLGGAPVSQMLFVLAALLWSGCAPFRRSMPEAQPRVELTVFNGTPEALRIVIDGRRVGEVEAYGRISSVLSRTWIEGRPVRVCLQPIGTAQEYCARERLLLTSTVGQVSVTVRPTRAVILTVT